MTTRRLTRRLRHRTLSSFAFSAILLVAVSLTFFLLETLRANGYFFLPNDPNRKLFLSLSAVSWPLLATSAACLCLVSLSTARSGAAVGGAAGPFFVSGAGLASLLLLFLWGAAGAGLAVAADVFLILGSRRRWEAAGAATWPALIAGGIAAGLSAWTALAGLAHAVTALRDFAAPAGGGAAAPPAAYVDPAAPPMGRPPPTAPSAPPAAPPAAPPPPLGARPPPTADGAYAAAYPPPPAGGYYDDGGGGHRAFGAPGAAVVAPPPPTAGGAPPASGPTGPVAGAPYVPPPGAGVAAGAAAAAVTPVNEEEAAYAAGVAAQARAHRLAGCVATCVGMGFEVGAARAAAEATEGDVQAAVSRLLPG